jgi:hypothetical protein
MFQIYKNLNMLPNLHAYVLFNTFQLHAVSLLPTIKKFDIGTEHYSHFKAYAKCVY